MERTLLLFTYGSFQCDLLGSGQSWLTFIDLSSLISLSYQLPVCIKLKHLINRLVTSQKIYKNYFDYWLII